MPKMVANRDVRVASLTGHVVLFQDGVIQNVPQSAYEDCIKVGVILAPGETLDKPKETTATPGGAERVAAIKEATRAVLNRNERDDFGAAGRPTARAIEVRTGFKTDSQERDTIWAALQYEKQQRREREALRHKKPEDKDVLFEAIATVIDALVERGAEDDFSRDGVPHVKAIEEFLGYSIVHEERDDAWKRYQARAESSEEESTEAAAFFEKPEAKPDPSKKPRGRPRKKA